MLWWSKTNQHCSLALKVVPLGVATRPKTGIVQMDQPVPVCFFNGLIPFKTTVAINVPRVLVRGRFRFLFLFGIHTWWKRPYNKSECCSQTIPGFLQSKSSHLAWQHDQKQALFRWINFFLCASATVSFLWWPQWQSMCPVCSCVTTLCVDERWNAITEEKELMKENKQSLVSCTQSRPTLRGNMTRSTRCSGGFCH